MSKYQRIELSDLVNDPNLKGAQVEVTGVVRGIQERNKDFGLRTGYTAFLEYNDALLLLQGDCDGGIGPLRELSMLRTSSETGRPIFVQGKIKGKHPQYQLNISGVKLEKYASILYKD